MEEDEKPEVWDVPVADLLSHCDPFSAWTEKPITRQEVRQALAEGRLDDRPYGTLSHSEHATDAEAREYHVRRIAWLVTHPDRTPIEIDIGAPSLGWHPSRGAFDFLDGNHRLCAAVIRGDWTIAVTYGGECDAFPKLFPEAMMLASG